MNSFKDWVQISVGGSSFDDRESVEKIMREKLAGDIQRQVRSAVSPGIDRESEGVAEAIRVTAEGNRFVINSESQGAVLGAANQMVKKPGRGDADAKGIEDLFEASSGVPRTKQNADGSTSLVYRTISMESVFRSLKATADEFALERTVENTIRNNIGSRYEDVLKEVDRRGGSS